MGTRTGTPRRKNYITHQVMTALFWKCEQQSVETSNAATSNAASAMHLCHLMWQLDGVKKEHDLEWTEDPKWVVMWSCGGKCTLCQEKRKAETQARGYKGLGYGLNDTFHHPFALKNDGSAHRQCQAHFEAEEDRKREEKKTELRQVAMEAPDFDEETFLEEFEEHYPEEESIGFDDLQTILGDDDVLLEVRAAQCEAQQCCKCNAPVPPDVAIGWSKKEHDLEWTEDPKWVVMWSCGGKCTLCQEKRKAKHKPGVTR